MNSTNSQNITNTQNSIYGDYLTFCQVRKPPSGRNERAWAGQRKNTEIHFAPRLAKWVWNLFKSFNTVFWSTKWRKQLPHAFCLITYDDMKQELNYSWLQLRLQYHSTSSGSPDNLFYTVWILILKCYSSYFLTIICYGQTPFSVGQDHGPNAKV